jgi:hypothetical protein
MKAKNEMKTAINRETAVAASACHQRENGGIGNVTKINENEMAMASPAASVAQRVKRRGGAAGARSKTAARQATSKNNAAAAPRGMAT